jgi:hypothetical protein
MLDPLGPDQAVSLFRHFAQLNESSLFTPDKKILHEVLSLLSNSIDMITSFTCDKQDRNLCFFVMLNLLVWGINKLFMNKNNLISFNGLGLCLDKELN